jgi:putative tricarboxylic transport membrane protein
MRRLNTDILGSFFWIVVGVAFLLGGIVANMGTLRKPGPGFLPVIMAGLVICFGLMLLIQGLVKKGLPLPRIIWRKHLVVIVSIIGYTFLIGLIGFPFSTFVLMFVLFGMLFEGNNRWVKAVFSAVITAFAAWLVFSVGCQVPFPTPLIFRG